MTARRIALIPGDGIAPALAPGAGTPDIGGSLVTAALTELILEHLRRA